MKISDLYAPYGPFAGRDIYIVGLGPSMRVFPLAALEDKCCVLLNDSYFIFPTLGPVAFANHISFYKKHPPGSRILFRIVRGRSRLEENPERDDNLVPWDSKDYHVFSYRCPKPPYNDKKHPGHWEDAALWREPCHYWSIATVAEFAVQFCAYAGARTITLCGCDSTEIIGKHYASEVVLEDRKLRGKNKLKEGELVRDYANYRRGLFKIKQEVWKKFQIPVLSLSPFMGIGSEGEQFEALCDTGRKENQGVKEMDPQDAAR